MKEPVAKRLWLRRWELARERQLLGEGEQVLRCERELHPGGVHRKAAERQLGEPERLGVLDPLLDVGVGAVAVATVDAVARRLLELAAPLTLDVVSNEDELEAVYRLRYEVVVEQGWARPADLPGDVERDRYDDIAVHIAAWDGSELAAAQRLVFPQDGLRLPTEEAFGLTIEPRGRVVDVGRSAISSRYRGDSRHLLLTALQGRSWLEWPRRGPPV